MTVPCTTSTCAAGWSVSFLSRSMRWLKLTSTTFESWTMSIRFSSRWDSQRISGHHWSQQIRCRWIRPTPRGITYTNQSFCLFTSVCVSLSIRVSMRAYVMHRCKKVDPNNKKTLKTRSKIKKPLKELNKNVPYKLTKLLEPNKKFPSKIIALVSYNVHDNVWQLKLFFIKRIY